MSGKGVRRLQWACSAAVVAVLTASCGSSPSSSQAGKHDATTTTTAAPVATTAPVTPSTLAPVATSGPLTLGAPIELPFAVAAVTAAESPDGAVFAAPQDPTSPAPSIAWVIDGNGPAQVAEHIATGIAALAADSANFYAATYSTVYSFDRASGNQNGQWSLPAIDTANASDDDLVAMTAAAGRVDVSITQGNTVKVYRIDPSSAGAPHRLLTAMSAVVGSDGTVYYESGDHHLDALHPDGSTTQGPLLADAPNSEGGGVQYLDTVAGGLVWVDEPAGQGLDATFSTFDTTTLVQAGTFSGSSTDVVADTAGGPLVLEQGAYAGSACPQGSTTTACVFRIDAHGTVTDPVAVGAAVSLFGPGPVVVASDTTTDQFELVRLS